MKLHICTICLLLAALVLITEAQPAATIGKEARCLFHDNCRPAAVACPCNTDCDNDYAWRIVAPADVTVECSGAQDISVETSELINGRAYQGSFCQHTTCFTADPDFCCRQRSTATCKPGGIGAPQLCPVESAHGWGKNTGNNAMSQFISEDSTTRANPAPVPSPAACPTKPDGKNHIRGIVERVFVSVAKCPATINGALKNFLTVTQTIKVQDTLSPEMHLPADRTVECFCPFKVGADTVTPTDEEFTGHIVAITDQCMGVLYPSTVKNYAAFYPTNKLVPAFPDPVNAGAFAAAQQFKREYTLGKKDCNNKDVKGTQTITVEDTVPPIMHIPSALLDRQFTCKKDVAAAANFQVTDACVCDKITTTNAETIFTGVCDDDRKIERVYTADDKNGNTQTYTQTIVVKDDVPPVITFLGGEPQFKQLNPIAGDCLAQVNPTNIKVKVTNNCNDPSANTSPVFSETKQGTEPGEYDIFMHYRAEDSCGNVATEHIQRRVIVESDLQVTSPAAIGPIAVGANANFDIKVKNLGKCTVLANTATLYIDAYPLTVESGGTAIVDTLDGGEAYLRIPAADVAQNAEVTFNIKTSVPAGWDNTKSKTHKITFRVESDAFRDPKRSNDAGFVTVKIA